MTELLEERAEAESRPDKAVGEASTEQSKAAEYDDDCCDSEVSWDDDEDWYDPLPSEHRRGGSGAAGKVAGQEVKQATMQKLQSRVNFEFMPTSGQMSHKAKNSIVESEKKANAPRNLGLTQDTRATVESCLDPRTMQVLGKFLKRGLFSNIHGCISTGKEANVYYATAPGGVERAVKVYKTSILVFKDRARYVEGEFRFRSGYCKGNPRKMVYQWAEKEMRNLKRLRGIGIMCPEVVEVRQNVLVMEFIGTDGNAAPRLKDTEGLNPDDWFQLYAQCVLLMRKMFQECKLVHGDLSEYNMLYKDGDVVMIDVSQSVEHDHPHALDFLKRDCVNVNNFFSKMMQRAPVPVRKLFDFVVTKCLPTVEGNTFAVGDAQGALEAMLQQLEDNGNNEDDIDDEVFLQTWIPTCLDQVANTAEIERELKKIDRGEEVLYSRLLAGKDGQDVSEPEDDDVSVATVEKEDEKNAREDIPADGEDDEDSDDDEAEDDEESKLSKKGDGHKPEGMSKAEWKQQVKEEKKLARLDKCPKHLKKKYKKAAARGH